MTFEITATGMAAPERRMTNDDLAQKIDTNDEWIFSHTGIRARHIADDGTAASDLGAEAARRALEMAAEAAGSSLEEATRSIDVIIVATVSGDYFGGPATACLVQQKLGAMQAPALDVAACCTGFVYALEMAAGFLALRPKRKRALVIGAEVLSRFTDWTDRSTCVLFGDGAGAVILEKREDGEGENGHAKRGLIRTTLKADGAGAEHLVFKGGGGAEPFKPGQTIEKPCHIVMNGRAVYQFAVKSMTDIITELTQAEGISIDDLAWIVPHQANARMIQAAAKRLGIAEEKFFLNMDEYANTSAASIPIALDELNRTGKLHRGDRILTVGFGGGLTAGGNIIIW